jgi:hypothetical protein
VSRRKIMTEHVSIQDPHIHEPKGISVAVEGALYIANGAGSGSWGVPFGLDTAANGQVFVSDGLGEGNWETPGGAAFGSVFFTLNAVVTTITTQGVNVTLDPGVWAMTVVDSIVFDTNKFIIPEDGIYEIHASLSFAGGAVSGDIYRFSFANNGAPIASCPLIRRQTGSTDIGNGGTSTFQLFSEGDEISILVQNESNNNNLTVSDASFTIVLLKEE